jgi:hypothetical protein
MKTLLFFLLTALSFTTLQSNLTDGPEIKGSSNEMEQLLTNKIQLKTKVTPINSKISDTIIKGKVSELSTGEPILFATISLYKDGSVINQVETDFDGIYYFSDLNPDTYDIEASFIGYKTQKITGIVIKNEEENIVDIIMEKSLDAELHDEIIIKEYRVPLIEFDNTTTGISISTKRKATKKYSNASLVAAAKSMTSDGSSTPAIYSMEEGSHVILPSAGQITAGEWNDLNNWEDWNNLILEENYKSMQSYWDIHPDERYSVFLTNNENLPIVNAKVDLLDQSNKIIWTSKTDNAGKAELWNTLDSQKQKIKSIRVSKDNIIESISHPVSIDQGSNHIHIDAKCAQGSDVDIAFIVDATASMGDEIRFLKSELSDIISRLEDTNDKTRYRTSAVFYKDHRDRYLTKTSPLTDNINTTLEFIQNKTASGGGDYAEAVEEGIEEALALDWNPNAVARLAFLILDAPPHYTPEIIKKLKRQVTEAAAQGIKLIPVTASGINRNTEFLMKYLSIITNGTYVFITDHSGIGHGHLEPVVDNYEVERLNDLIVRLIENYGSVESCNTKSKSNTVDVLIYPNPASEVINVELDQDADRVILRSSSGKIVLQIQDPKKGINTIKLDNIVGGMYTVQVGKDNEIIVSRSVIVIN